MNAPEALNFLRRILSRDLRVHTDHSTRLKPSRPILHWQLRCQNRRRDCCYLQVFELRIDTEDSKAWLLVWILMLRWQHITKWQYIDLGEGLLCRWFQTAI